MSAVVLFEYETGTQTFQMPVYTGGQSGRYAFNYNIQFDATEWRVVDYTVGVQASQDYNPIAGVVKLGMSATFGGFVEANELDWTALDSGTTKSFLTNAGDSLNVTQSGPLSIVLQYSVPSTVLSSNPAIANVLVQTQVVFESLPGIIPKTNPGGSTPPGTTMTATVTDSGNKQQGLLGFLTSPTGIIVAVIGAAALGAILLSPAGQESTTIITSGFNRAKRIRRKK